MARPRKQLSKEHFEKLCALMCTEQEICGFFGVTDKTLNRWCKETYDERFSDVANKYAQDGKISLRRTQFKLAERSASMAIWLGKQILGQEDKVTIQTVDDSSLDELEKLVLLNEKDNEKTGDSNPD